MKSFTIYIIIFTTLFGCTIQLSEEVLIGNWKLIKTDDPFHNDDFFKRLVFYPNGDFLNPDDKFQETDTEGSWELIDRTIIVNYHEGSGTEYLIQDLSDSTLTLIEDQGTLAETRFQFERIPFDVPNIDTLRTGSFYEDQGINEIPTFEMSDANTNEILISVNDSTDYFVWIKPSILKHYKYSATAIRNGTILKTLVRDQFELLVYKTDLTSELELQLDFNLKNDSIFILHRNWIDESKTEYTDVIVPYFGQIKLMFRIK